MHRILMIDDDHDLLELTQCVLREEGYQAEGCSDWSTAIEKIRNSAPNLILLDVFLNNNFDGLHICDKLKNSNYTRKIPILVMSGFPQFAKAAVVEYGATDFMAKPFHLKEMIKKVNKILGERNYLKN